MDPEVIAACRGRYTPDAQPATPAQRRFLRWYLAVVALVVLGWAAARYLRDGWQGAAHVVGLVVTYLVAAVVGGGLVRRSGQHFGGLVTRVDDDGLFAQTAWRESRTLAWGDVVAVEPPGGFHAFPVAVVTDGSRQELPGLPVEVAQRLDDALLAARGPEVRRRPRATEVRLPGDDGWDDPFHRGGPTA